MKKVFAITALSILAAVPVGAHEFWLQPATFMVREGNPVSVRFMVGDAADVTPWKFAWEKLHTFKSYGPDGIVDHQTSIDPGPDGTRGNATLTWHKSGTHMLVLESYHQPITLPATQFNAYLAEDGLTSALDQRKRTGTTDKPGREIYSRRTKALVQVGNTVTAGILQPIGQTLEIVPERNPYGSGVDTQLPVRVMFQGRYLKGALVALTALGTGSKPVQREVSDADGRATFDVPRRGNWMVSVVWTRPMTNNTAADYDTIFSSMTFGYSRP